MTGQGSRHTPFASSAGAQSASDRAPLPRLDGVEHRFIDLPGLRMHVAEAGSGDPVLLLHGFPQHWWEWRDVIPGVAERYRVICPDLRGAGWTDAPRGGYRREQLLADVVALLDALELDRVNVIGHDWGAIVGYHLCLRHPNRVGKYICLGGPHPYLRFHPGLVKVMWRLWFQLVIAAPVVGRRLLGRGRQRLGRHLLRDYGAGTFSAGESEVFLAGLRDPARARAGSSLYRGFIMSEAGRIIGGAYRGDRLTTPTWVLIGDREAVTRPEFLGGYEKYADDLTVELVAGAAHFVADERPDVVIARALDFFAEPRADEAAE